MTENTQLANVTETQPVTDAQSIYSAMIELARDPSVDPAKMETMLSMQERMLDRQNLTSFRRAMHEARIRMPIITKEGSIKNKNGQVQSRYAHYEAIDKLVRPIVQELGLTYGFDTVSMDGGRLGVTCIVSHIDGHEERFGPMPLAIDTTGSKNATQGAGSATSYGKRYTLCAAFNIVTEGADDDGTGKGATGAAPDSFAELVSEGQKAAVNGTKAYAEWFKGRTNMERGYLMDEGHHNNLKEAAQNHD